MSLYEFYILFKQVNLLFSVTIDLAIAPQQYPGYYSGQRERNCHGAPTHVLTGVSPPYRSGQQYKLDENDLIKFKNKNKKTILYP